MAPGTQDIEVWYVFGLLLFFGGGKELTYIYIYYIHFFVVNAFRLIVWSLDLLVKRYLELLYLQEGRIFRSPGKALDELGFVLELFFCFLLLGKSP